MNNVDDDRDVLVDYGDLVEHKMNTDVFGIVIGTQGSLVHVRLSPSLAVSSFHQCELRLVESDEYHEPPAKELPDNVIPVDFTKRGKLDRNTKTEGAA